MTRGEKPGWTPAALRDLQVLSQLVWFDGDFARTIRSCRSWSRGRA